jgi:hypothetical protein
MTRAQRREGHATHRRLQKSCERLQREPAHAPRHLQALEPALVAVGVAASRTAEVQWRLQTVRKRRGQSFGLRFPTIVGGRTYHALTRVRAWDKHLPLRLLGALPKQTWRRPLPHRGQAHH